MTSTVTLKLPIVVLLALCSFKNYAQPKGYVKQGRYSKRIQAIEFGFSSVNTAANYKGTFYSTHEGKNRETYAEGPAISKGGLGVNIGDFIRLARIGKETAITADATLHYSWMYWNMGKGFFIEDNWTMSGTSRQFALPIGLSLRFGADGRLEKNHRFCFGVGGGIMPTRTTTVLPYGEKENIKFRHDYVTPYIKVEAGLFSRICWKLRLTYAWGDMPYVDRGSAINKNSDRAIYNYKSSGKASTMLSVIIMPFSFDWPDNGWWNNSRTSKMMY